MSKRKWRRGSHIMTLDELARQEIVCWWDKPTSKGWFMSWQFRMAMRAIGSKGVVFYALPAGITTRFSDEEVIRAERRLHTAPTLEGRQKLIELLNEWDEGIGDVDDTVTIMEQYNVVRGGK